ncbi:MAG TPA: TonB-dependent receptor [Polyangiaceae bacterium]|nr:TonB-dependent receptor [Polyangiaceae bacterium]
MRRALACTTLALALALASPALAQSQTAAPDTSDLEGLLDTQVVSAPSKTPEAVSIAPSTSIVLSAEDMKRYGIRSIDEAINFLAFGMVVEKRFQTGQVGSRGVLLPSDFGSHVLLMVDGHVLNEQWGATSYIDRGTTIPFELIDHIEVVLGPGSVLYGSNAMLGIVHIVTKRAKDFAGVHIAVESELPISIRGAAGIGKEFRLFGSDAELVLELEHYQQKGPTFDYGPQKATDPDGVTGNFRDFDVKPGDRKYPAGTWGGRGNDAYYTQAPSGYMRLRVGDFELGVRAALYKRTDPTDSGNFDDPDSYEIDRWLNLDLKHSVSLSSAVRLSTRLYADSYDYDQYWRSNGAEDCLEGQDSGCLWTLHGEARNVGLEPQLSLDWFEDGRAVTLLGVDGRIKQIKSSVDFQDNVTGISPGKVGAYSPTEKALAAYVQQTFWLGRVAALNGGARVDVDDRFGSHLSPRASLSILPWRGGTLKAMYSAAFRAPTAFDIYYHDPASQIAGGKSLKPETVRSVEASFEQRFGAKTLQIGVFRSWWDDLLLLQDLTDEQLQAAIDSGALSPTSNYGGQVRNVSSITSYGFNLGFEGSLSAGRLRYGASLTEAIARRHEADGSETQLAVAPEASANARLSYDLSGGLPTLALAGRYVARRPVDDDPIDVFAKPFWETRATVSGPFPALPALSYRLSVNYIGTDRGAFRIRSGTLPNGEPELNPQDRLRFAAGLQYDFSL